MKEAIVLNKSDIKKILAQWYAVEEKYVLPSKYSFTVIIDNDKSDKKENKKTVII